MDCFCIPQCIYNRQKGVRRALVDCNLCDQVYHLKCLSKTRKDVAGLWLCRQCVNVIKEVKKWFLSEANLKRKSEGREENVVEQDRTEYECSKVSGNMDERINSEVEMISQKISKMDEEIKEAEAKLKMLETKCEHIRHLVSRNDKEEVDKEVQKVVDNVMNRTEEIDYETVLIGDSLIRECGDIIARENRNKYVRLCFPGARIRDVTDIVKKQGSRNVYVMVGTNNLSEPSERVMDEYIELIRNLNKIKGKVGIVGLLPRFDKKYMLDRACSMNERLRKLCERKGVMFVDVWDCFIGKRELYSKDGLHLGKQGSEVLGSLIYKEYSSGNL